MMTHQKPELKVKFIKWKIQMANKQVNKVLFYKQLEK